MGGELLNFDMIFRNIRLTEELHGKKHTTNPKTSKAIITTKAKSPATLMPRAFQTPNLSSPPSPVPHKTTIPKTTALKPPMPKHRATPIMIPKTLPPKYQHPPAKAAATTTTTVQRRPVPSTGLTSSMLRDYSKKRIDEDLRHLGKLFYGPTCRFENNKLTLDHYNNVREVA